MLIQQPCCFFNLCSCSCLSWAAVLPCMQTSQVSHSSPSATPLPHLPHLRVVPVWGLAVVHCLAVLGAAWSTNESHRNRTVRGEPDGWDPRGPWSHARKVPPYEAEKKCFLPLTAGTHRLYLRTEGSASLLCKKTIPPVDRWDPSDLVADLWAY